ncbi:MAG: hypothetical protein ACRDG4_18280 [Chloroflexota bacterium]
MRESGRGLLTALLIVASLGLARPGAPAQAAAGCGPGVSKTAAVRGFYTLLDHGNYATAFACYAERFRTGTAYATWRHGYAATLHTQLLRPPTLLTSGDVAVSVLATDMGEGHRIYTWFAGTWTLVRQNGWRLNSPSIHITSRKVGPSLAFNDRVLTQLSRTAPKSRLKLPASLPFPAQGVAWEIQPIEGGLTIILGRGEPIADATTLFSETASNSLVPTAGVDGTVSLLNGSRAYYYAPFNHGGNGRPDLEWSQDHIAYQITYACESNCLKHLAAIANSLQAYQPPPS